MIRTVLLVAALGAPLMACNTMSQPQTAEKASVDAVVLDESKRAEAASTAEDTGSSAAGLAAVSEGPKDQKPVP